MIPFKPILFAMFVLMLYIERLFKPSSFVKLRKQCFIISSSKKDLSFLATVIGIVKNKNNAVITSPKFSSEVTIGVNHKLKHGT